MGIWRCRWDEGERGCPRTKNAKNHLDICQVLYGRLFGGNPTLNLTETTGIKVISYLVDIRYRIRFLGIRPLLMMELPYDGFCFVITPCYNTTKREIGHTENWPHPQTTKINRYPYFTSIRIIAPYHHYHIILSPSFPIFDSNMLILLPPNSTLRIIQQVFATIASWARWQCGF